jgi:lipopolysaccharide/colanic/teichoic acid biosynthesis glycosyltransferase
MFDRSVAFVAIMAVLPLLSAVAIAVRMSMGKGVFYRQSRVGRGGQEFRLLKFRTLREDRRAGRLVDSYPLAYERRVCHKRVDDPRHTPVGRFLRRWSLDELPQLLNILRGEMSWVGPRPELPAVVRSYEPWQHLRHVVRPGLTGLWQVTARGDGSLMRDHVQLDILYVREVTFGADLRILARTVQAVGKGS